MNVFRQKFLESAIGTYGKHSQHLEWLETDASRVSHPLEGALCPNTLADVEALSPEGSLRPVSSLDGRRPVRISTALYADEFPPVRSTCMQQSNPMCKLWG